MIRKDGSSSRNSRLAVPKLKEKLDKIFSQYIRLRDSDENGDYIAVIGDLEVKRQSYCKITVREYRELIDLYTKRVNALKIEKNL